MQSAMEQALMGVYWISALPAGMLALYLCYRVCFHRERWYAKTCRDIIQALPDPVEYWREAASMEELDSFPSDAADRAMAGDPYFRFLILGARDVIRECMAAYDALYGEGRRRKVSPGTLRRMEKAWRKAVQNASVVTIRWHYRDIRKMFAIEKWRSSKSSIEHFADVMRDVRPGGQGLLSWREDRDEIRLRARWRNDFPGIWVAVLCPPGTPKAEAGLCGFDIRTGCGKRPMRKVLRKLRRKGRFGMFKGAEGEVFVRTVPTMPEDDYYCPSDLYYSYAGGELYGEAREHDTGVPGEVQESGDAAVPAGLGRVPGSGGGVHPAGDEGGRRPAPDVPDDAELRVSRARRGGVPGGRKVPAAVSRPALVPAVPPDRPRVEAPGSVQGEPVASVGQGVGRDGEHGRETEAMDWRGRQHRVNYRRYDYL